LRGMGINSGGKACPGRVADWNIAMCLSEGYATLN
jgi:hypothetical protein